MTTDPETDDRPMGIFRNYLPYWIIGGAVVLVGSFAFWISQKNTGASIDPKGGKDSDVQADDTLERVRRDLDKTTDFTACRTIRQQLNGYLQRDAKRKSAPPTKEQKERLIQAVQLDAGEMAELDSSLFTLLDDHHLDQCFLLRDAARSLEVDDQPLAERARIAFAWVVRQVALQDPLPEDQLPPPQSLEFVLRRGWSTSLERSLIFVHLLKQLGVEGCLIAFPPETGKPTRYWACGALIPNNPKPGILLFDPRLGMPIPGPGGRGIATLSEAQSQPDVLQALSPDSRHSYDVTAEQAAKSRILLSPLLSGLSPRMKTLQDEYLAPAVRVNLFYDVLSALDEFKNAGGDKTPVQVADDLIRVQRSFWPPEEGGTDLTHRKDKAGSNLIPIKLAPAFVLGLPGRLKEDGVNQFAAPFFLFSQQPHLARDQILRGQYSEAAPYLVEYLNSLKEQKDRYLAHKEELGKILQAWRPRIIEAAALLEQAKGDPEAKALFDARRKEGQKPMTLLIEGESAELLAANATFQMALCKLEQAERRQERLDRQQSPEKPKDADVEEARNAWNNALSWWNTFVNDYPPTGATPYARFFQARCHEALGDRERARSLLESLAVELNNPFEQVACLLRIKK